MNDLPPLTTVRQSFTDLAMRAVQMLLDLLADRTPDTLQVTIKPTLIVRDSTAAAQHNSHR